MATRKLVSFDWAIKKLLRNKANFDILEGFLSELIKDDLKILELLESESNQNSENDKYNRVDLKVQSEKNGIIIIEIQYEHEIDFFSRILWSTSKVITEHLKKGEPYGRVSKVISVSIVYADIGVGSDYLYRGRTQFIGMNNGKVLQLESRQKEFYELNQVYNVFPEYYLIKLSQFKTITKDTLDEWIYFLKNSEIKDSFRAKGLQKAQQELDVLKLNPQERQAYEAYQENLRYQASMWLSSYGQGEKKGIEKGKKDMQVAIAKSLLDILDKETIALKTGLTVEEVKQLMSEK